MTDMTQCPEDYLGAQRCWKCNDTGIVQRRRDLPASTYDTICDCEYGSGSVPLDSRVNPDHYKVGGVEVIDVLRAKLTPEEFRGFCKGNVVKYSLRAERKGEPTLDYQKAAWYASWLAGKDPR